MTIDRNALARVAERAYLDAPWNDEDAWDKVADAVIAHLSTTPTPSEPEGDVEWEYGIDYGDDDSPPRRVASVEDAHYKAEAKFGDKVVRRTPSRTIPAGPWQEVIS